jgi:hypothetical protein
MSKDSVVEEVRAIRDAYARQFDYDIEAICRDLRAHEATCGHEVVSLPPKRIPPTETQPEAKDKGEKAA